MRVVAVIAAAGSGTRLGAPGPKALVDLAGEPLIVHAVRAMRDSEVVDAVVVTAPHQQVPDFVSVLRGHGMLGGLAMPVSVVPGGVTRQASVRAGLDAAGSSDFVLIHDAARPLTPASLIRRVVAALQAGHQAVVPALPVTDTIKRVGARAKDGTEPIAGTLDRTALRAMQTPQGFALDAIRHAHHVFAASGQEETTAAPDDAYLAEAAGIDVVVVPGDQRALKITRPFDLLLAEFLANQDAADGAADVFGLGERS